MPGVLGVVGSLSTMATRQVQAALDAGVTVVPFNMRAHHPTEQRTSEARQVLTRAIAAGRHAVVWTNPGDEKRSPRSEGQRVLRSLGTLVRAMLSATAASGLVIVGGDTARAVFSALQATGLTLSGQVEAGIPYGRLMDGPFAGLPVVTKAGGFGGDTTLQDCLDCLHRQARQ